MQRLIFVALATLFACNSAFAIEPATTPVPPVAATTQTPGAHRLIPIGQFLRQDGLNRIKLSPSGKYFARTIPLGEKVVLTITRRSDGVATGHFNLAGKTQVLDFWWVNDERLLISVGQKFGELERPQPTGQIYATNADGSGQALLVGWLAAAENSASHITVGKKRENVGAELVDDLPDSPNKVIIAVYDLQSTTPYTRAEEMDVYSGTRTPVARAPVRRASFVTDAQGVVRFAIGAGVDNFLKTYYRDSAGAEWQLINDEAVSEHAMYPLGFTSDGRTAYIEAEEKQGPNAIYAFDTASHQLKIKLRDATVDPMQILYDPKGQEPIGARYMDGKPKVVLFDAASPLASLYQHASHHQHHQCEREADVAEGEGGVGYRPHQPCNRQQSDQGAEVDRNFTRNAEDAFAQEGRFGWFGMAAQVFLPPQELREAEQHADPGRAESPFPAEGLAEVTAHDRGEQRSEVDAGVEQ